MTRRVVSAATDDIIPTDAMRLAAMSKPRLPIAESMSASPVLGVLLDMIVSEQRMIEKRKVMIENDQMQSRIRNPAARRLAIRRALTARGAVSVDELCREFDASPATIRRDLAALRDQALIERTFGGAAVPVERP